MATLLEQLNASNKEIRGARAKRVVSIIEMAQTALVNKLKYDIMRLQGKIEAHLDFGRTNTTSLTVSKIEEGSAEDWVKTYQEDTVKLAILKEEFKVARKNYKKLFGKSDVMVEDVTKEGNMDEQV